MILIYEKLEQLLNKTNKTLYRVAKDTGIPASTFYEWRQGHYKPKVDKLIILADYFGVPLDYFIVKQGEVKA